MEINLKGKKALIAGVGDDMGFGWAIAKTLNEAGCDIILATWTPIVNIFETSWKMGKFNESRKMQNGQLMEYKKLYSLDASFDKPEDVPQEIKENKRYKDAQKYTISEVAEQIKNDFGTIDFLVHSLANGPEVKKPLLETSRQGYLAAISSSSYSFVSMVSHFGPIMNINGACINLTYIASTRVIPGYGGGMSSAKAALESDTLTLAFEAGQKWSIRINSISAGPLKSRAAKAIGMIDTSIEYYKNNAPLHRPFRQEDVASTALFLLSPMASAITGEVIFVDNGMHAMGMAIDSKSLDVTQNIS
jgi:enoyl-[acyl-carrier protein] reductase I